MHVFFLIFRCIISRLVLPIDFGKGIVKLPYQLSRLDGHLHFFHVRRFIIGINKEIQLVVMVRQVA